MEKTSRTLHRKRSNGGNAKYSKTHITNAINPAKVPEPHGQKPTPKPVATIM